MKQRSSIKPLIAALCFAGAITATQAFASAFQLWEQDGASVGNYHAGYAALANDASISFYNPAGMTRLNNPQLVLAADPIITNFNYNGTVRVNTINNNEPQDAYAKGGTTSVVPAGHYVYPVNDRLALGFSVVVPFGLQVDYGHGTPLRYGATEASVAVYDITPTIAYRLTKAISLGLGFDIQRMYGEFDQDAGLGSASDPTTAWSTNKASDTGYGYHAGVLVEFTPNTRVGLSYHSQVAHHLTGTSRLSGPLASFVNNGQDIVSDNATLNIKLPAYTALSGYHRLDSAPLAFMASVIFTQWNSLQTLDLKNVASIDNFQPSTTGSVTVPMYFKNSWNFSAGTEYYASQDVMLRLGLGYDQTPLQNQYRGPHLPDNNRYVVAVGGHYQATKTVGLDLAWSHFFFRDAGVYPPVQSTGLQETKLNGTVEGSANVFGAQVTWDIV